MTFLQNKKYLWKNDLFFGSPNKKTTPKKPFLFIPKKAFLSISANFSASLKKVLYIITYVIYTAVTQKVVILLL